jgi:hypothetical protein
MDEFARKEWWEQLLTTFSCPKSRIMAGETFGDVFAKFPQLSIIVVVFLGAPKIWCVLQHFMRTEFAVPKAYTESRLGRVSQLCASAS